MKTIMKKKNKNKKGFKNSKKKKKGFVIRNGQSKQNNLNQATVSEGSSNYSRSKKSLKSHSRNLNINKHEKMPTAQHQFQQPAGMHHSSKPSDHRMGSDSKNAQNDSKVSSTLRNGQSAERSNKGPGMGGGGAAGGGGGPGTQRWDNIVLSKGGDSERHDDSNIGVDLNPLPTEGDEP